MKGRLDDLVPGRYLMLKDGAARVMLITFNDADYRDDSSVLMGLEVEVTGIVREDPGAPANPSRVTDGATSRASARTPAAGAAGGAARVGREQSITLISHHGSRKGRGRARRRGRWTDTGVAAAAAEGKPVRAIGQFRGANSAATCPRRAGATSRTGCS